MGPGPTRHPAPPNRAAVPAVDVREVVDAILYVDRNGWSGGRCRTTCPPWKTVYHYFRLAEGRDVGAMHDGCAAGAAGRGAGAEPGAAILDSQSVKTTEKGGPGLRRRQARKWPKRHILVDTLGLLLVVVVHAANIQECDGAKLVLRRRRGGSPGCG